MSTPCYDTIESQISEELSFSYGYRNLHTYLKITNSEDENTIIIPHESITNKYLDYLKEYVEEYELDEKQYEHFRGNPQAFSDAMYGTTQYWALILELNKCKSRMEFNKKKVLYYNKLKLEEILNEIMMKEKK